MKKKMILISGAGALVLAGSAFVVASLAAVPKEKHVDWEPLRGTESYYTGDPQTKDLPDFVGNLKGSQGRIFIKVGLSVVYRLGPELLDAAPRFAEKNAMIMDRLHMIFAGKSYEDVDGSERKQAIKDEIKNHLQMVLFPDRKGRVEDLLYRSFYIQ